jgi:hypothetical protein
MLVSISITLKVLMALTIMGIATTECITVPTVAGTTSADSMVGTAGSTEAAATTEPAKLVAQPILAVRF